MLDPFAGSKRRLARAKEHVASLDAEISAFFGSKPWTSVNDPDPNEPNKILGKIRFTRRLPDLIYDLAEEAIEGLRAALDKTAFVIARNPLAKSAYFPIADSAADLENVIKGRCKDLPPEIVSYLRIFLPYKGGNDLIWAMNKARQRTLHGLISIGATYPGGSARLRNITGGITWGPMVVVSPIWNSEKNEITFFKVGAGSNFEYDLNFSLYVAIDDPDTLRGQPLVPALNAMATEVEPIIVALEAEARRLGLFQ